MPVRSFSTVARTNLSKSEVHIWKIPLDIPYSSYYYSILDGKERERLRKLRTYESYKQYLVCRYSIKNILSSYIGCLASECFISYTKRHKPFLENARIPLKFNISHSKNLAVCVVTLDESIGVDLEFIRPIENLEGLSEYVLSRKERLLFYSMSKEGRLRFFYKIWTRKEAFLKACGDGFLTETPLNNLKIYPTKPFCSGIGGIPFFRYKKRWVFNDIVFSQKGGSYQLTLFREKKIGRIRHYNFYPSVCGIQQAHFC